MKKTPFIYICTVTIYSRTPYRKCYTFTVRLSKPITDNNTKQTVVNYLANKHNLIDVITANVSESQPVSVNDIRFPKSMLSSVIIL